MAFWNPREVLDFYPSSDTCTGLTKRGLRCKISFISYADRHEADHILDIISNFHPSHVDPASLERLAYLSLCPRWHRQPGYSQVKSVSQNFRVKLATYAAQTRAERLRANSVRPTESETPSTRGDFNEDIPRRGTSAGPSTPMTSLVSLQSRREMAPVELTSSAPLTSGPRSSNREIQTQIPDQHEALLPSQSPRRTSPADRNNQDANSRSDEGGNRHSVQPLTPPATPPATARVASSTVSNSAPSVSSPATTGTNSPGSSVSSRPSTPTTSSSSRAAARTTIVEQSMPSNPTSPSSQRLVARKACDEPCPICYLDLTEETSVYCRRQCGTNVHESCFDEWRLYCLATWRNDGSVTCVFCRATWD